MINESTVTWIAAEGMTPEEMRTLKLGDPALGHPLTIEPFPGSTWRDLVTEIHGELAVSPTSSTLHLKRFTAHEPLEAWGVSQLVVLEAQSVAPGALSGMVAAIDHAQSNVVLILSDDPRRPAHIADTQADLRTGSDALLHKATTTEPRWPLTHLDTAVEHLNSRQLKTVVAIAEEASDMLDRFPANNLNVAAHHAADELFSRPLTEQGAALRLYGLDLALVWSGRRLTGTPFSELITATATRDPRTWLPTALHPPINEMLPRLAHHDQGEPACAATASDFVSTAPTRTTQNIYAKVLNGLLSWRQANDVPTTQHCAADLERWAIEQVLNGVPPSTVTMRLTVSGRYLRVLLTGDPEMQFGLRRMRPEPARLADSVSAVVDDARRGLPGWMRTLSRPSKHAEERPFNSARGRKFLAHYDGNHEAAWAAIRELRVPTDTWWWVVDDLVLDDRLSASRRHQRALNANLLIFGAGIPRQWLPPEAGYSSPATARTYLDAWIADGRWAVIRHKLSADARYANVDWSRAA